jgi:hypothetical protein
MEIVKNFNNAVIMKKEQIVEGKSNLIFGQKCNEIDL